MRVLKAVTIIMGALIIGGTALLGVLIMRRISTPPTPTTAMLDQPAGSHLAGIANAGASLAVLVQGGGPDRVLIIDPRSLKVTATVSVRH